MLDLEYIRKLFLDPRFDEVHPHFLETQTESEKRSAKSREALSRDEKAKDKALQRLKEKNDDQKEIIKALQTSQKEA